MSLGDLNRVPAGIHKQAEIMLDQFINLDNECGTTNKVVGSELTKQWRLSGISFFEEQLRARIHIFRLQLLEFIKSQPERMITKANVIGMIQGLKDDKE